MYLTVGVQPKICGQRNGTAFESITENQMGSASEVTEGIPVMR